MKVSNLSYLTKEYELLLIFNKMAHTVHSLLFDGIIIVSYTLTQARAQKLNEEEKDRPRAIIATQVFIIITPHFTSTKIQKYVTLRININLFSNLQD